MAFCLVAIPQQYFGYRIDEYFHSYDFKKVQLITTKFCTYQDSTAVLVCATFCCDQTYIRWYINILILSSLKFDPNFVSGMSTIGAGIDINWVIDYILSCQFSHCVIDCLDSGHLCEDPFAKRLPDMVWDTHHFVTYFAISYIHHLLLATWAFSFSGDEQHIQCVYRCRVPIHVWCSLLSVENKVSTTITDFSHLQNVSCI